MANEKATEETSPTLFDRFINDGYVPTHYYHLLGSEIPKTNESGYYAGSTWCSWHRGDILRRGNNLTIIYDERPRHRTLLDTLLNGSVAGEAIPEEKLERYEAGLRDLFQQNALLVVLRRGDGQDIKYVITDLNRFQLAAEPKTAILCVRQVPPFTTKVETEPQAP